MTTVRTMKVIRAVTDLLGKTLEGDMVESIEALVVEAHENGNVGKLSSYLLPHGLMAKFNTKSPNPKIEIVVVEKVTNDIILEIMGQHMFVVMKVHDYHAFSRLVRHGNQERLDKFTEEYKFYTNLSNGSVHFIKNDEIALKKILSSLVVTEENQALIPDVSTLILRNAKLRNQGLITTQDIEEVAGVLLSNNFLPEARTISLTAMCDAVKLGSFTREADAKVVNDYFLEFMEKLDRKVSPTNGSVYHTLLLIIMAMYPDEMHSGKVTCVAEGTDQWATMIINGLPEVISITPVQVPFTYCDTVTYDIIPADKRTTKELVKQLLDILGCFKIIEGSLSSTSIISLIRDLYKSLTSDADTVTVKQDSNSRLKWKLSRKEKSINTTILEFFYYLTRDLRLTATERKDLLKVVRTHVLRPTPETNARITALRFKTVQGPTSTELEDALARLHTSRTVTMHPGYFDVQPMERPVVIAVSTLLPGLDYLNTVGKNTRND